MLRELADEFPDVGRHQNHYAWALVTCPAVEFRDPELSLRYAKRAVQLSPQSADYWFNLGFAQYRTGDFTDAVRSIERGRKFATGGVSIDAALVQAMAYWKVGDRDKGVMLYRQAVKDVAHAPLVQTTSIDYRVQRAEADQIFVAAEQESSAPPSDEHESATTGSRTPPLEEAAPADKSDPQEESN
jgi:tetratricopeptide (TPR) repeat protein